MSGYIQYPFALKITPHCFLCICNFFKLHFYFEKIQIMSKMKVSVNFSFHLCDFDQHFVAFSSHVESSKKELLENNVQKEG